MQFLVSWISVLDSVPDIDLLGHLPKFLDGLFKILSDPNSVRQPHARLYVTSAGNPRHVRAGAQRVPGRDPRSHGDAAMMLSV